MHLFLEIQYNFIKSIFITIFMSKVKVNENKKYIDILVSLLIMITTVLIPELMIYKKIYIFFIYAINIMCILIFYNEGKLRKFNSYLVAYFFVQVICAFKNVSVVKRILNNKYIGIYMVVFIIIFSSIFSKVFNKIVYIINSKTRYMITLTLVNLNIDYWIRSDLSKEVLWQVLIKLMGIIFLCVMVIIFLMYVTRIQNKSEKINEINNALENKNNELRKIKHDYGAQISYLYGLCLLKRWDELGKSVNRIYEKNKAISNSVHIVDNENSVLFKALEPALNEGIHIIIKENIKIESTDIDINDLFKVFSHIRYTAVRTMNGQGIIIATVNKRMENIVVEIENSKMKDTSKETMLYKIINFSKIIEGKLSKVLVCNLSKRINIKVYIKNKELSRMVRVVIPMKNSTPNEAKSK